MDASDSSLLQDHSELDPLNLTQDGPEQEEGELTPHSSSPESMDQDDVLGCGTYLDGGLASDTGVAPGRLTDFQSDDMDTTAQPSGAESCSELPMESQDVRTAVAILNPHGEPGCAHSRGNPEPTWGEGENETPKRGDQRNALPPNRTSRQYS